MKKFVLLVGLLLFGSSLTVFSKEIYFDCKLLEGSFLNVTYDPDTNTGSIETNYVNRSKVIIYQVVNITRTSHEVIFEMDTGYDFTSSWIINRSTLRLSHAASSRKGICEIIEKDNKF